MDKLGIFLIISYIFSLSSAQDTNRVQVDCNRPPPYVNPHSCCQDAKPTDVAVKCAQTVGFPLPSDNLISRLRPPSIQTSACFADCVLRDSRYIVNGNLNPQVIVVDIQQRFANDPEYIAVMTTAFGKCAPIARQRLTAIQNSSLAREFARSCSPFAGLILGCVYMEYFQNCPTSKWNNTPACNSLRTYIRTCANRRST